MLYALLQRLFGRSRPPLPRAMTAADGPPTAPMVEAAAPRRAAAPASPAPASAGPLPGLGARRPLVAVAGGLAGFEFTLPASAQRQTVDERVARACTGNLLGAMRLCAGQGLVALAELPGQWLARCTDDQLFVPGMQFVLQRDALSASPDALNALLQRLRGRGVKLGWQQPVPGDTGAPAAQPDFVLLPPQPGAQAAGWREAVSAAAASHPRTPLLLLDLPDVDLLEAVLQPPVSLAACVMGQGSAQPRDAQPLPPQAARLLRLLNRLVRDDDNALLVADIKADAALSVGLLQHLNSAGASPGRVLDSIDEAVQVLGRDALYRWVARMLVRLSPRRPAGDALQAQALARARLLELLGRALAEPNPGSLYLLGLASMLPLLLHCPIEEAVLTLQLPSAAEQALLDSTGPWLRYLAMAKALERNDVVAGEALAQPYGGLDAVQALAAQAWASD